MALLSHLLHVLMLCKIAIAQEEGELRLVDGATYLEGRVEIFHAGYWGTVCDDHFGTADGEVICNSLGYGSLDAVYPRAFYGQGNGPIWMDEVTCSGNEASLTECSFPGWGYHDCSHREDAGVKCQPKSIESVTYTYNISALPLRISCPPGTTTANCTACPPSTIHKCSVSSLVKGILEARYEGEWYPVTGDGWGVEESRVACGQLGYPASWNPPSLDQLWPEWDQPAASSCNTSVCLQSQAYRDRLGKVLLQGPICTGYEQTLLNCSLAGVGPQDLADGVLTAKSVATVECGIHPPQIESCYPSNMELYRLRGGPLPWSGRVEVKVAGSWTTVCDDGWGVKEASLVCRALGYGTAESIYTDAHFGRGSGDIDFAGLQCSDQATSLRMCSKSSQVPTRCQQHAGDAGVICHHPQPDESCPNAGPFSRLHTVTYQAPDDTEPVERQLLEIKHNNVWGRLCYEAVNIHVANAACKESRGMFVNSSSLSLPPDDHLYNGLRFNGSVICLGEEASIAECLTHLTGSYQPCSRGYAAVSCIEGIPDLVPSLEEFQSSLYSNPIVNNLPMSHLICAVDDNCLASSASDAGLTDYRSLLRFDSLTMNLGTHHFRPNKPESAWVWHNCHRHFHSFEAFIHYDLLDDDGSKVAEGHKASFCLEDSLCLPGQDPTYSCAFGTQGISANCGDLYGRYLDCQWIDVTGVPSGHYTIRQEVNPSRQVAESDYGNNVIECSINYNYYWDTFQYFIVGDCSHSDH